MNTVATVRQVRSYVQRIAAPPGDMFALLCPVRERDWLDGWDCTMIHSESGLAEEGCLFTTGHHGPTETVWSVTRHDPPRRVAFFRVTPGLVAVDIDIAVRPAPDGGSAVEIRYTTTALSEAGAAQIQSSTDGEWHDTMDFWERSMNHYLRTGEKLKRDVAV